MYFKALYYIYIQAILFSINLSVLSPLINTISNEYDIDLQSGYLIIGGINNLLIFGSMALSSLSFSFYKGEVSLRICSLLLFFCNFLIYLNINIISFLFGNLVIGITIGIAIPTIIRLLRENIQSNESVKSIVILNIMIGFGQILGQYMSAILIDYKIHWNISFFFISCLFLLNHIIYSLVNLKNDPKNIKFLKEKKVKVQLNKESILYLSQYLPGAIPWGALTIFIFPFSYKFRNSEHSLVATYMVFLSIGMLIGSLIAGFIADKLNQIKKIFMLVCIIVFLLLSSIYFYYFVSYYTDFSENLLFILFLIMGSILSIPGTYIKGLLFMNASEEEVQKLFAIENFLESLGKGFGPLIVGILIFITSDLFFSFQLIGFFWVLCLIPILIIFFDEYKNKKRPQ